MRKRHVPPSRIRYEAKKPTLSFRVTKEELQEIRETKRKSGLKLSTLMLQGARISEELKESYARGYQRGYRNAFGRFLIRCGGCGDPIEVDLQWPSVKGISLKFFGERIQHYGGWLKVVKDAPYTRTIRYVERTTPGVRYHLETPRARVAITHQGSVTNDAVPLAASCGRRRSVARVRWFSSPGE